MDTKLEGIFSIIAALFVLVVALLNPWISAILAVVLLIAFGIVKLAVKGNNSASNETTK